MKDCNQCGKCCQIYGGSGGLSVTQDEIDWWDDHRPEIARYVSDGQIWIDPKTGEQLGGCPWLRKLPDEEKYTCDIYFDRPDDCRQYPVMVSDMIRDECEMIEVKDLLNPSAAQEHLNRITSRG
ncbi:MAG: Fe-S-cluster containining protein [Candidatus Azotimanducaceae bacterium]|jgi:Fe-S-cluster containining protein